MSTCACQESTKNKPGDECHLAHPEKLNLLYGYVSVYKAKSQVSPCCLTALSQDLEAVRIRKDSSHTCDFPATLYTPRGSHEGGCACQTEGGVREANE